MDLVGRTWTGRWLIHQTLCDKDRSLLYKTLNTALEVYHLDVLCEGTAETLPSPCMQQRVCVAPVPLGRMLCLGFRTGFSVFTFPCQRIFSSSNKTWKCVHQPPRNSAAMLNPKADHYSLLARWCEVKLCYSTPALDSAIQLSCYYSIWWHPE